MKKRFAVFLAAFSTWFFLGNRTYAFQGLPNFSGEFPQTTITDFVLGPVCLSLPGGPFDLSCNPAFLATEEKKQFRMAGAANDHVAQLNDSRMKLRAGDATSIVSASIEAREPKVARASSLLWYQRDWWALGFSPFRGGLATSVRNPAYPEVAAHVYAENEVFGKVGFIHRDDPNLHIGLQLRYVQRDFFRREFDLLDALGNPSILKVEKQNLLYVEPGVSYSFDSKWQSAVSASITQIPVYHDGDGFEFKPVVDVGFSSAPPFFGRRLRTSTHYNGSPDQTDILARFRWGAVYDIDHKASVAAMLGKSDFSVGASGRYDSIVFGLAWKSEEIKPDKWQTVRISTFILEGGLAF